MANDSSFPLLSDFLQYLAYNKCDGDRLPALSEIGRQLKISTTTLREQLEVARSLGLVEVKPRTGIRRLPYRFTPAVLSSLAYATAVDNQKFFRYFSDFRNHIESAYWFKAVSLLTEDDYIHLRSLISKALDKLNGNPIQIPHDEHRELHLSIYRRLNNPFVLGVLEAYWEVYEAVGLNLYTDITYHHKVWSYHHLMVEAICNQQAEAGYQALISHTDLLFERVSPNQSSDPEFG